MADIVPTAADVGAVRIVEQFTGPTDEVVTKGQACRLATATGKITLANGSAAGEARMLGIAITGAEVAGMSLTVLVKGDVDLGDVLTAMTYDDDVYLSDTDGALGTGAGDSTVNKIAGQVVPSWVDGTADKLFRLDL